MSKEREGLDVRDQEGSCFSASPVSATHPCISCCQTMGPGQSVATVSNGLLSPHQFVGEEIKWGPPQGSCCFVLPELYSPFPPFSRYQIPFFLSMKWTICRQENQSPRELETWAVMSFQQGKSSCCGEPGERPWTQYAASDPVPAIPAASPAAPLYSAAAPAELTSPLRGPTKVEP